MFVFPDKVQSRRKSSVVGGFVRFVGGTTEGTGMVISDATLDFLGGATEGTGI